MKKGISSMRQLLAVMVTGVVLALGGVAAAQPANAAGDERTAYYNACVHQSGNTHLCGCLADLAMGSDAQLRADMILSMSNPGKYRATRAPHIPNAGPEMQAWEQFDVAGNKKCGMDI